VFAPSPCLTVTIEQRGDGDDIHVHAGGQGFWVARMLATLEIPVAICGAFGGETGTVIQTLIEQQGIEVRAVDAETPNSAYVHDRRSGERRVVSETPVLPLSRHDVDELYGAALVGGLAASITVVTGSPRGVLPDETFRRLTRDLRANGTTVVADLVGGQLRAALAGGIDVLKVSHSELIDDGWADGASETALLRAMSDLRHAGARTVVISRAQHPALVLDDDAVASVEVPTFEPLDHRGAGDSMTAGIAAALAEGAPLDRAIRLGAAAGTLNVTRRGLASGERSAIEQLAERVELRPVDAVDPPPPPPTTTPEELASRVGPA